jgi:hypothetical protein
VLSEYINGRAMRLSQIFPFQSFAPDVNYLGLLLVFVFFTFLLLVMRFQTNRKSQKKKALLTTTWLSALAPLSWFVLFKAHSYIHTQMNYIVWQMPFTLYGIALCGYALGVILNRLPIKAIIRSPRSDQKYVERTG